MTDARASARSVELAHKLRGAADALIAVVEGIAPDDWAREPRPGTWSPGKDAEHVADGAVLHQWIVRTTLRQRASPRPHVPRERMTADHSARDVIDLLRQRTEASVELVQALTDDELDLEVRPPRARPLKLGEMIEGMIHHYDTHRGEIEAKLRALARQSTPDF